MERHGRKLEQDNSIENKLQEMLGFTDEMLLKEFEAASKDRAPLPISAPPSNEFELIWSRIQEESSNSQKEEHNKVIKFRFRWKRAAAIGLTACILVGGGCFVAVGKKSYFYRERPGSIIGEAVVYDNDSNMVTANEEADAYSLIGQKLGIRPLKLSYKPYDMSFADLEVNDGYARMRFKYEDQNMYFIQSKYDKTVSYKYDSNKKYDDSVENKWINKKFNIDEEELKDGSVRYSTTIVIDGAYYSFLGIMDKAEFKQIVSRMTF